MFFTNWRLRGNLWKIYCGHEITVKKKIYFSRIFFCVEVSKNVFSCLNQVKKNFLILDLFFWKLFYWKLSECLWLNIFFVNFFHLAPHKTSSGEKKQQKTFYFSVENLFWQKTCVLTMCLFNSGKKCPGVKDKIKKIKMWNQIKNNIFFMCCFLFLYFFHF